MKHLKLYKESIEESEPKIGDYVIIKNYPGTTFYIEMYEFISNNIGQIIKSENLGEFFRISYNKLPNNIAGFFQPYENKYYRIFNKDMITDFSSNKKELKLKLAAKKYNL